MRILFAASAGFLVFAAATTMMWLWEMFDNEEGIDE